MTKSQGDPKKKSRKKSDVSAKPKRRRLSKKVIEEAAAAGMSQTTTDDIKDVDTKTGDGAIIINGEKIVLPGVEVHTWHDHDMQYTTENSAVTREEILRWIVLHWTASERTGLEGAKKIFNNLLNRGRGLSVEFFICNEGIVWQFADPGIVRCRHSSRLNKFSAGLEVSNQGHLKDPSDAKGTTARRELYPVRIHGWRTRVFNYLEPQQHATNVLVKALLDTFSLPYNVLMNPWCSRHADELLKSSKGVCGHLHCVDQKTGTKIDPGMRPLINVHNYLYSDQPDRQITV